MCPKKFGSKGFGIRGEDGLGRIGGALLYWPEEAVSMVSDVCEAEITVGASSIAKHIMVLDSRHSKSSRYLKRTSEGNWPLFQVCILLWNSSEVNAGLPSY